MSLYNATLTALVDELTKIGNASQLKIIRTKYKCYRIQDVRLAAAIEARDCIKRFIKRPNLNRPGIRFEAFDFYRLDMHRASNAVSKSQRKGESDQNKCVENPQRGNL